jgi:Flp pilus assembly protein TadG
MRNRKGVIIVIFGIMMVVLMGAAAMSIDMSRIWAMRNELQTAADAAALAGAIQLTPPYDADFASDTANSYARRNLVLGALPSVDQVQLGVWDDSAATFTNGATPTNAVRVIVSHTTSGLIMGMLGVTTPTVHADAIAWANAPVPAATCVKPWSIPYVTLMYRINLKRNLNPPNSSANLTRTFDQNLDLAALNSMTEAERTFTLKMGPGKVNDDAAGGTMPGNFNPVKLPRVWDAATGTSDPEGSPPNGAAAYEANVGGATCHTISVGDSLETETGNMPNATIDGVTGDPGICDVLVGEDTNVPSSDPTYGNCLGIDGNPGVTIKAAFHLCRVKCNGNTKVGVEMVGSFKLKKVYPTKSKNGDPISFDKNEIQGVFVPAAAAGPVGPGPTTLTRLILVK